MQYAEGFETVSIQGQSIKKQSGAEGIQLNLSVLIPTGPSSLTGSKVMSGHCHTPASTLILIKTFDRYPYEELTKATERDVPSIGPGWPHWYTSCYFVQGWR